MPETPARLVERLESEGQKTIKFFQDLAAADWERTLYTDGACWTVRQVLAHFVKAEAGIGELIEHIQRGGAGVPENFDLRLYNERRVAQLDQATPDELIQQFEAQRKASVELVSRLATADLSKTGRHPFLGFANLEDIIKLMYRHNQIHQRDIRKLLAPESDNTAVSGSRI